MAMGVSKQITYNTAGSVVTLFCQWMIMMIIPKITVFSEAGVFAVALSICSILNIFATFQLNQYQISDQYVRYTENDYRAARLTTIALSFALCLFVVLFFNYTMEQNLVIIMYMVYRNLLHYAYLYTATLQIHERLDHVGKCMMLEGIVSFASFTVSYYLTNDLVSSVAIMAVLGGGVFLLTTARGYHKTMGRGYPWHAAERSTTSSLIKMGAPFLLSVVAPIVITALPKIMLQAVEGDEIVGIFGTLSAPTIVVPTLIMGIFAPFIVYFSNISRKGDISLLRKQYSKMVVLTLMFGVLCFVLSYVAAGYLFEAVYGDDIVPYVGYFNVMIIGITFYSIGMWGITVLITKNQGRAAAIASALSLAAALVIFIVAIPGYGISGATYGLMAAYGIFGLLISLFVLFLPLGRAAGPQDAGV
ncbi:MAG: oligosaccharide flippase family protein [Methanomassiliicoccaceae archaeon]|nr:oligosaccharide flippase family protein [Methanomassiliicoccaceae archaeon]